jgi:hypothetical protein
VIGGLLLALAVVGAIVVPSLVAGPEGVFAEVPVALPPESGVSVVHARPTLVPHDRLSPLAAVTARPKAPLAARVRPTPRAVPATASPRPVSRPAAPTPAPVAGPAPAPAPAPSPVPPRSPVPAPDPTAPGREILVSEPEPQPATPPHGQPVVDEPSTAEPSKNEGEKKGHEKNEPQGNAYGRDDDEQGGPKPGRGPGD